MFPDEDFIGKIIYDASHVLKDGSDYIEWLKSHKFRTELPERLVADLAATKNLMGLAKMYMTEKQFQGCLGGMYASFSSGGKRFLKNAYPEAIDRFSVFCSEFSVQGPVRVDAAWRLDKSRSDEISRYPTFEELVSICEPIEIVASNVVNRMKM